MSNKLVVFISEHWPHTPAAPWVLVDERDRVRESGTSEARHWPAADDCELVLSGPQCAWLRTRLPGGARGDQTRLLRYALEDQLIRDVDEQHFTITDRVDGADGPQVSVLVIARSRLRQLLAQLESYGRKPVRIVSALQTGAIANDGWSLTIDPLGGATLHRPAHPGIAMEVDTAVALITHLAASDPSGEEACQVLTLQGAQGLPLPDLTDLTEHAGIAVRHGPQHQWWSGRRGAADLLHGEFAPGGGGSGLLRGLKWPLTLAAGAALVLLAVTTVEVLWQRQQLHEVEQRMRRLFETSVPNTPAIAPAVQLQRSLDDARARHGQLRQDDFLALLDAFAEIGGADVRGALQRVEYEAGVLRLVITPGRVQDLALLQARLGALGYDATPSGDGAPGLNLVRRTMR